jgi:LuxR family maltose regulon positive regulatory protein
LVALTLQQRLTGTDKLDISGKHRFIADYLAEDVLTPLPEEIRRFLFQTNILDRLCGSLCDAVTGREDGQAMLEALERDNLFLVPLDDSREWFRYHRLFAEFLNERLNHLYPDEVADLHRRAAGWFQAHNLPEQAFRHAVDGDDIELVIQILERYFPVKLLSGEIRLLERWLDLLPEDWHSDYPLIGFVRAGILLSTGQFDACARRLDKVEQTLVPPESEDMRQQRARVTALRCYIACFQNDLARAQHLAEQALRELPEADLGFRPGVYGALGHTYRRHGRWEEAEKCYLKLLDFSHAPAFRVGTAHVFGALADLDLRQGHLREAAMNWGKALAAIQDRENWGLFPLPVIGWVYIRLGEILYEWNELAEAWDYLSRGLEHAELGGDVRAMIAGYLIAGRLKLTEGDTEMAAEYLEQARPLVERAQFSH